MKKNDVKKYVEKNSLQITMQVFAVIVTLLNLWIATKLAPVTQDLAVITTRVEANELEDAKDHPSFVTKDSFQLLKDDVSSIKVRVDQIYGILAK